MPEIPHIVSAALSWTVSAIAAVAALLASVHAVIHKREPRSAAIWLVVVWLLPAFGSLLYLLFGINRVERRAVRLSRRFPRYRYEHMSGPAEPPDSLAPLAHLVSRVSERPLLPGNAIEVLIDGGQAYPAMLEAIRNARESVALCSYIFDSKGIGAEFVAALSEAAARGVQVRVLIDDVDARFSFSSAAKPLRRAGVKVGIFNPPFVPARLHAFNLRNHRKILIVDATLAFTGGMNIDQRYWRPDKPSKVFHDLHFRVRGPVVGQLMEVFASDWQFATEESLRGAPWFTAIDISGRSLARVIEAGPDGGMERLRWVLAGAINAATRTIQIATPYFLPDSGIVTALNAAALRGVAVDILMPRHSDLPHVRWAAHAQLWQVLSGGGRAWESDGTFDHSKLIVVDAHWTMFGSPNWDARSLRLNFELGVESYCEELGAKMSELLRDRVSRARPITMATLEARPFPVKLRDGIARLAAPHL